MCQNGLHKKSRITHANPWNSVWIIKHCLTATIPKKNCFLLTMFNIIKSFFHSHFLLNHITIFIFCFVQIICNTNWDKKLLTNHSHFSLQVTSNSITKFMPNNFHPQDLSLILQTIPTYTTSERISTSIALPTTF